MRFAVIPPDHPHRLAVEAMVRAVFRTEYQATLPGFPQLMIAVFDAAGEPQCAAGLRDLATGFFCEQYLPDALERHIGQQSGRPVPRTEILELGSLAASRPGALPFLLRGFADLGLGMGYRWAVFTATARLRRMIGRLGVACIDLGPALADCVLRPEDWGSYYDCAPRVCAVYGANAELPLLRAPSSRDDRVETAGAGASL